MKFKEYRQKLAEKSGLEVRQIDLAIMLGLEVDFKDEKSQSISNWENERTTPNETTIKLCELLLSLSRKEIRRKIREARAKILEGLKELRG